MKCFFVVVFFVVVFFLIFHRKLALTLMQIVSFGNKETVCMK